MAIAIFEKGTDRRLFTITPEQLEMLQAALEEESEGDHDYYIDAAVCDFLDGKVDADVVAQLRDAVQSAMVVQQNERPDEGVEAAEEEDDMAGERDDDDEDYEEDDEDEDEEDEDEMEVGGIEIVWRDER